MDGVEQGLEPAVRHLKAQELRFTYGRRSLRYSIVLRFELRVIARHAFAVIVPETWSAHYTSKFSDKPLAYIVTQCLHDALVVAI